MSDPDDGIVSETRTFGDAELASMPKSMPMWINPVFELTTYEFDQLIRIPAVFNPGEHSGVGLSVFILDEATAAETPQQRALPRPSHTPPLWANDVGRTRRTRNRSSDESTPRT